MRSVPTVESAVDLVGRGIEWCAESSGVARKPIVGRLGERTRRRLKLLEAFLRIGNCGSLLELP